MNDRPRYEIEKLGNSELAYEFINHINLIQDDILKNFVFNLVDERITKSSFKIGIALKKTIRGSLLSFIDSLKPKASHDITWAFLCDIVTSNNQAAIFCSPLLLFLLNNDLYKGLYKDKLLSISNLFDLNHWSSSLRWASLPYVNDDIKYFFVSWRYLESSSPRVDYHIIRVDNSNLRKIVEAFCSNDSAKYNPTTALFYNEFDYSLNKYATAISTYSDFNFTIYKSQFEYYKQFPNTAVLIGILNRFYIYLIEHPSGEGKNIFKDYDNIDINFLKRSDFTKCQLDGFSFLYYNPLAPVPTSEKWILHINGYERTSTKCISTTTQKFDFSQIKSSVYKTCLMQFVWNNLKVNFTSKYEQYRILSQILNYIYDTKSRQDYPNPSLTHFNIWEAHLIRNYIDESQNTASSKEEYLCAIRIFLTFLDTKQIATFELMFFKYLQKFKVVPTNHALAIPKDELCKINKVLIAHKNESYFNELCYTIFHVCLQTEFRISSICHLHIDCITETMKDNQFLIKTTSKTSNGQKYIAVVSDLTKLHLENILKLSATVRNECPENSLKKYLFVYRTTMNNFRPISAHDFRNYFSKCCKEAGTPIYSASNLRDTHMTKALEYKMRHAESDVTLAVLSGHKNINTTQNHYIEIELTKMLESTYGIIIGDVTITGEIVDIIENKHIENAAHSVEHNCGYCKQDRCSILNSLSCLMCCSFITTVNHAQYFRDSISQIDIMIPNALTQHDKDDLVNIKRLYCAYLMEILKKKGAHNNE
ncbi:site-specific integrase [Anaerobium acetethylicum]|uniref:Phage integrase family protein n=1 Tax=Anaerobium acetethylicum TaxID=1619234 RepID=A0A1D3TWZ6_9FIRM|nr:site-specific integrase [Anaerobium acetethylicum]SCP98769.1 Phage integrase family protein [Anaerobium acetethylicum]